jgi:DNA-binding XRE family transcriptional regulator
MVKYYPLYYIQGNIMLKVAHTPYEVVQSAARIGENIRIARIRRRMSQEELAQACNITRRTLYSIEKGSTGIALGTVFSVLWSLGLMKTILPVADPDNDEHGKIMEAARQPHRVRHQTIIDNDF